MRATSSPGSPSISPRSIESSNLTPPSVPATLVRSPASRGQPADAVALSTADITAGAASTAAAASTPGWPSVTPDGRDSA
jgi:hypothetical protein